MKPEAEKYKTYTLGQWVTDPDFISWCKGLPGAGDSFGAGFIAQNPEQAQNIAAAKMIVLHAQVAEDYPDDLVKKRVWEAIAAKKERRGVRAKKTGWKWLRRAAVFLLIAGGAALLMVPFKNKRSIATGYSETKKIELPDHSMVVLNAKSVLRYGKNWKREVFLSGEAYFDVAHDGGRPFVIHTKEGDIKVLGTAFNVKAFDNGFFETALIRGKVAIHLKQHAGEDFVLSPGQKLVTGGDSVSIAPVTIKDNLVAETSWTRGQLVFVNKPLVEIAAELERFFGVTIVFSSDATKQYRYTGIFDNTSPERILEILALSKSIRFHREHDLITIE